MGNIPENDAESSETRPESEQAKILGKRLREAREARHLSQGELGSLVGVSRNVISNWECAASHLRGEFLGKLENALRLAPGALTHGPDVPDHVVLAEKSALAEVYRNIEANRRIIKGIWPGVEETLAEEAARGVGRVDSGRAPSRKKRSKSTKAKKKR